MNPITSAMNAACKARQVFAKYKFTQEKNSAGYTINASDAQFIQNGGGMCRDFVCQQAKMLKRMRTSISFDSIMFMPVDMSGEWDMASHLHAFTVIYSPDGGVYVPESTLDALMGVWYFPTMGDCISAVRTALGYGPDFRFRLYSYIGDDDNLIGRNREQTVAYVQMNGLELEESGTEVIYEGIRIGG